MSNVHKRFKRYHSRTAYGEGLPVIMATLPHPNNSYLLHDVKICEVLEGDQITVQIWPKAFRKFLDRAMEKEPGPLHAVHVLVMRQLILDNYMGA